MATISEPPGAAPPVQRAPAPSAVQGWVPANPAPLGLMGFGITTLMLSILNANLVSFSKDVPVVLGMAIAYGGTAQLLAGMWEFRTGNVFGAVAFSSYGAFWISFFFLVSFDLKLVAPSGVDAALGLYLWAWALFTAVMFFCSFAAARAVSVVFALLVVTFIFLAIGNAGGHAGSIHIGGYFGIATALAAIYTAAGEIMASAYGRSVLPLGRPGSRP